MSKLGIGYLSITPLQIVEGFTNHLEDLPIQRESISNFKEIEENLLSEKITVAMCPLDKIPMERRDHVVIGALTKRENPSEILVLKKEKATEGMLLKLGKGASVTVFSELQKAQFGVFRDDLDFRIKKSFEFEFEFDTDAALLPDYFAQNFDEDYLKFSIQPEELMPTPGQGAFGLICLDTNMKMRKILKNIHHKGTAAETNIERAIQKGMKSPVVVFCKKDNLNHFHVYATTLRNGALFHFSHSSGTSFGLVERVIESLGG